MQVARIERVAEGRRGLRGTLEGEHALGPGPRGASMQIEIDSTASIL
jgi:hypothetical protein